MYLTVGIYKKGNNIEALKIYDTDNQEMGMYHKEQIYNGCNRNGLEVGGIRNKYYYTGEVKQTLSYDMYNIRLLDIVDENGNPLTNDHVRVPISTEGFGKSMKITLVDSMGRIEVVGYDELIELIENKKVTGVRKSNNLSFHKLCVMHGNRSKSTKEINKNEGEDEPEGSIFLYPYYETIEG